MSARFPCVTEVHIQHHSGRARVILLLFIVVKCGDGRRLQQPNEREESIHSVVVCISPFFLLSVSFSLPFSPTSMDHQTRLFQMLNAATSPPPSKSVATASSPREPQPTAPPPTLQSVSLNDLFKGIQLQASSPSVSANGSSAGAGLEKALNASVAGPKVGLSHVGQHTPGTRSASQAGVGSVPVSSPPPASGPTQDQKAKLLGMLSFGASGVGTPVNVSTSGVPTPHPGYVQPESQASAPFG